MSEDYGYDLYYLLWILILILCFISTVIANHLEDKRRRNESVQV